MKRIIIPWGVILLIISMALVTYAKMEKVAISKDNLAELKGNWTGDRGVGPGDTRNTDLEIANDTLPVQGKFVFYDVRGAGGGGKTVTFDFKGKINQQGNLLVVGGNTKIELSLYKDDGKMKLEGNYFWYETKGTMSFKKK